VDVIHFDACSSLRPSFLHSFTVCGSCTDQTLGLLIQVQTSDQGDINSQCAHCVSTAKGLCGALSCVNLGVRPVHLNDTEDGALEMH